MPALRRLLAGEDRFSGAGSADDLVWHDERLCDEIRAGITFLET